MNLKLFFPDQNTAKSIFKSIEPEYLEERRDRSLTKISVNKSILSIDIKAKDITALKAGINGYLKSINLCNKLFEKPDSSKLEWAQSKNV